MDNKNNPEVFKGLNIGYALCGSFCTFAKTFKQIENLISLGANITPILSFNAANIDTRFGKASEHKECLTSLCKQDIIDNIAKAEPIGPNRMFDILVVAPCTGNTLAKLANGITDTAVVVKWKQILVLTLPFCVIGLF